MFEIIIGAVIIFFLWSFFSRRKKAISSFDSIDEAESWFNSEGIDFPTLIFNTYNDPQLAKNIGATVIVGFGQKADGKDVGFVIEVVKGSGVVESTYIEPVGIASHHKKAAFMSKTNGKYLIDTLTEMAVLHRKNYPQ